MSVLAMKSDRIRARRTTMTLLAVVLLAAGCEGAIIDPGDLIGDMSQARCQTPCDCADRGPPDYSLEKAGRKTPNGDEQQQAAIVWANHWRTAVGLKALHGNDLIEKAAAAHASYLAMAKGACDVGAHNEKAGCPGFTGADPGDRITTAGYQSSTWGEVVFSSGASGETAVAWWIFSVYHRLPFMNYKLLEMGAGHESDFVVDFGTASGESGKKPSAPVVFPPPGSEGIPPVFDGNTEGPRPPPPPATDKWPAGVPISIHFHGDPYTIDEHHLYKRAMGTCTEVPHAFFDGTSDPNLGNFAPDSAFFYADMPMSGGTEYIMSVKGTAAGQPYTRAWAFTTR